jgi:hypothetical protein
MATVVEGDYIDPLTGDYVPERVNYATGVMLQADDFQAEQTYHRGRLAQMMRHLMGFGTLAGLKVLAPPPPPPEKNLFEIRVQPGIAVDRYGRLIEIQTPQCIDISRWFAAQPQSRLRISTHNKPRTTLDKAVVADIFLSTHGCGRGKTPSFATGPFDALDALVAARVAENPRLELVLRSEGNPDPDRPASAGPQPADIPKPQNFWPKANADAKVQLDAVMGCWDHGVADSANENLKPLVEHVPGREYSALLLARIAIPVTAEIDGQGNVTTKFDPTKQPLVDNSIRPFIYLPGKWFGQALT